MTQDEVIYLFMLLLSIALGYVLKHMNGAKHKQLFSTGVGVCLVVILCKWQCYHSLLSTVLNALVIKAASARKCHVWSFVFSFSYLAFFRAAGPFLGFERPTAFSNVVQLILTLKLIGVAFEIHDSYIIRQAALSQKTDQKQEGKTDKPKRYVPVIDEPSILELFHYGFCFVGLLTGPYFKYKTYYDMLHHPNTASLPSTGPILARVKIFIPVGCLFLLFSHFFSVDDLKQDVFYKHGYWYRTLYMVPVFVIFRTRMYSAWLLSECVCMSATLGAYPKVLKPRCGQGPSVNPKEISEEELENSEYDYETINNIDVYMCDMTTTFRDGMRHWNKTVQWWLKSYIYVRCPLRQWSTSVTMLVSAYWHGVYPGYYLSFLTVPMVVWAEDLMIHAFRSERNQTAFDWANWFLRMRAFDFLACGFLLLWWEFVIRYWASTYFIGHILTFAFIAIGFLNQPKKKRKGEQSEGKSSADNSSAVISELKKD